MSKATTPEKPPVPKLKRPSRVGNVLGTIVKWFDSGYMTNADKQHNPEDDNRIDWLRVTPFLMMHLGVLGVLYVGISPVAVGVAVFLYFARMFAVTGIYHRYFSHRSYETSRPVQFLFALWGLVCIQRGPLWWAAHHRHHHRHSDKDTDLHSPVKHGFWWSHMGWILSRGNFATNTKQVRDLARYPELVFLNRFEVIGPLLLGSSMLTLGWVLQSYGFETSPLQMLVWGFFVSTVFLFHGTCTINSLTHMYGSRRFETTDHSRNNFWLALITMGEGWHNNHHYEPGCARQGLKWWEIDMTYYILVVMSWTGLIWNIKPPVRS